MSNTMDDHMLTKAAVPPRDDMVYKAMNIWMMDIDWLLVVKTHEKLCYEIEIKIICADLGQEAMHLEQFVPTMSS